MQQTVDAKKKENSVEIEAFLKPSWVLASTKKGYGQMDVQSDNASPELLIAAKNGQCHDKMWMH